MKRRYYWPNHTGVVLLLLYFVISFIACFTVWHYSQPGNDVHFAIVLILLILSPGAIIIFLIIFSFVKVTETTLTYYKYCFIRYEFKLSDITEWGSYNTCNRSGWFLYITSIPIYLLRQGDVINQDNLKYKNRKKFILLNYDDQSLLTFLEKHFPNKKNKLYRYPDKYYRQE